jgi:ATP-dependent DNA helicase PIF1
MPSHRLTLKVGSPIMLLGNIEPPKLCNGTRLCEKKLLSNVIEATILTGTAKGEDVFIPRIPLIPNDMPFDFRRLQFRVRLAFAMTINKAQGRHLLLQASTLKLRASRMVSYTLLALELEPQKVFTYSLRPDRPRTLCTKRH